MVFQDIMLLHNRLQTRINIACICTGKKNSGGSFYYCEIHFIVVV